MTNTHNRSETRGGGCVLPLPKTVTLFMTSLKAHLRPKSAIFPTLFMTYYWPDQKFDTLFMTRVTKMAKIDTLFMTKTAEKPYPFGPHIPI